MEAGTAIVETLHEVRNALATVEVPPDDDEYVYGPGIASAMKNIGFGHGFEEEAGVEMAVTKDRLRVATGTFEYGQGSLTVIEQLAAESAGVPVERVKLDCTATELSPETGPTTASRRTLSAWLQGVRSGADRVMRRSRSRSPLCAPTQARFDPASGCWWTEASKLFAAGSIDTGNLRRWVWSASGMPGLQGLRMSGYPGQQSGRR